MGSEMCIRDRPHGACRAYQEMLIIQAKATVPIRMDQASPRQRSRCHAHLSLRIAAGYWKLIHDLNSGMSGFAPHAQKDSFVAENCRGWWLASFSAGMRLTPVEYS